MYFLYCNVFTHLGKNDPFGFLNWCGYIKVVVTCVKFSPQVLIQQDLLQLFEKKPERVEHGFCVPGHDWLHLLSAINDV